MTAKQSRPEGESRAARAVLSRSAEHISTWPFGKLAPILTALGYQPVPITPGSKAPKLDGWTTPRTPKHYLPRCADWGTGILTATTSAIDLDIRDAGIVRVLIRLAEDLLEPGPSPIRIGAFPKALLPFSTTEPFKKITTRWFALPGEDFTAAGFKGHRVECLADGNQFVAYAVHPGTGRRYRWQRGSLLTYHAADLAPIDQAQAQAFIDAADGLMVAAGMIPLVLAGGRYKLDLGEAAPRCAPRGHHGRAGSQHRPETVPAWHFLTPGELAKRLDPSTAHQAGGRWRLRCPVHHGESADSLVISKGDDQGLVWFCHAGCTQHELAQAISGMIT